MKRNFKLKLRSISEKQNKHLMHKIRTISCVPFWKMESKNVNIYFLKKKILDINIIYPFYNENIPL